MKSDYNMKIDEIDKLKLSLERERIKNKKIVQSIRERKREILKKIKELEEEIKDIMYIDKLDIKEKK